MPFSGIVEEMGTVMKVTADQDMELWDGSRGQGTVLQIKAELALVDAYIGASIAVLGTCLTVTELASDSFSVNVAPETLRCTCLGDLKVNDKVNLERALASGARNSGHNVQGHVDETGVIKEFRREGESLWVHIAVTKKTLPYIVQKGYVAVDGTSLTVCEVHPTEDGGGWFNLMLIAHTQKCIVLPQKKVGEKVNIEVDVLGKYAAVAARLEVAKLESQLETMKKTLEHVPMQVAKLESQLETMKKKLEHVAMGAAAAAVGIAAFLCYRSRTR